MSFLRSVIADARPRKPILGPSDGPSGITGRKTRGLDEDASATEEKSPNAADQTSRLSMSLPILEGASDFNMGDAPAFTAIPDSRMNPPKGKDHDSSIASPETRGAQNQSSGHEETEPLGSPASIRDTPGRELIDNDGNSALRVGEGAGQLGVQETMSSAAEGNTPAQGEVAGVTAADDRQHSESSTKGPLSGKQGPAPNNSSGRNEAEKASAEGGKARQVSPSVYKQADMKSLANQEETTRLQKPDEAKGVLRDVQLVSGQVMAMEAHVSSDIELASVPRSAGNKGSTSVGSPGSKYSKTSSPVQHIARPARPSASPEVLRSVPARLFQTDLMPKDGDSFHSRAPLRYPEKKHEGPKVQIGQIDVIIEAPAQSAAKPAPPPLPIDLSSRHYLRRL